MQKELEQFNERRYPVFPVNGNKEPMVENGFKGATLDRVKISEWERSNTGFAVPTGSTGFFVVDLDNKNGANGLEEWNKITQRYSYQNETVTIKTKNNGLHLYFRMPDGFDIRNSASKIAKGIGADPKKLDMR